MNVLFANPVNTAIVMGCTIGCIIPISIVAIICWSEIKEKRDLIEFKQSMLERGLSAQEIEQIINAGNEETSA